MIDLILSETKRSIYNCLERYAKKNDVSIDDLQLILGVRKVPVYAELAEGGGMVD
jgi:hypothetical protein